uniref:Variant surface glycoprotein 1125.4571 n=1 Tax=Trypanosoma brucei TaxID=5691 RepID=A0A1J0RAM6_9TRYP|nr:variant surface glycoprotein 1125.4571 [Trypanosoma brucei]
MSTKHLIRTLLAAVAILAKLQKGEATGSNALPALKHTHLCAVAEEMATVAPAVAMHATQILNKKAERLRTGRRALLTTTLEAAYNSKCKTFLDNLRTEVTTGAAEVDAAAYLAGRIGDAIEFLADIHQKGGSNAGCLSTADGRKVVEGRNVVNNCGKERKATTTATTMPATELTSEGFPNLNRAVGTNKVVHGTALCHMLSKSGKSGINDQAVHGTPTIVDGYVKLPADGTAFALEDLTDLRSNKKQTQAPHFTAAFNAKANYKQAATMPCDASAMTIDDIKNAEEARERFWRLLQNGTGKYNDAKEGDQVKKEVETVFQPATHFAETWLDPALKNKVARQAAGEEGSGQIELETENDIDKLRRILNYYSAQEIKRQLTKPEAFDRNPSCTSEAKPIKKTPTKEDCKEHKEKEACQNAGCKFDKDKPDGEKCFPESESKTEKKAEGDDGKTTSTNTTGSNSVVINKAPLLFRFASINK